MNIYFSYKAENQLGELPFDIQMRIRDKVQFFMEQGNIFTFAKFVTTKSCYRFRAGNYRLRFIVENHEAKIVSIDPRDKAYN